MTRDIDIDRDDAAMVLATEYSISLNMARSMLISEDDWQEDF